MKKRRFSAIFTFLLLLPFLFSFSVFGQGECIVCKELSEKGFPESYRESLCALRLKHEDWEFIPLKITELSRSGKTLYDFPYVLNEEYQVAGRSLVSAKAAFSPYQETGSILYDRGFYQASKEGIGYFLDARNFLSEEDVFQFLLLSGGSGAGAQEVSAVLENCAVGKVISSLPEKLVALGQEMNINPLFLAARLRQEQGSEGNELLFGTAGEAVKDESLSGFYNIFNIAAYGTGEKQVYRTGAEYARNMGWNTPERALMGGARILAEEYVNNYQDTLYLQKWNVDPRSVTEEGQSRNFWAQFMQNIGGAKTESDFLYEALKDSKACLSFLIPVYENMPEEPCPDPAGGACLVFAAGEKIESEHLYPVSAPIDAEPMETKVKEELKKEDSAVFVQIIRVMLWILVLGAIFLFLLHRRKTKK